MCDIADTGEKAIVITPELKPDIIIMDVTLSGSMDGIETAEHIHRSTSGLLIFLTGYADDALMDRARAVNPTAILKKPAELQDILDIIGSP